MRNSSTFRKFWYIASSVETVMCKYDRRIACCFASSRENTMTFLGVPISPPRIRRTSTLPSEPVPPVIRIRLRSNSTVDAPLTVGRRIGREVVHHFAPGRRCQAGIVVKSCAVEIAQNHYIVIGLYFDIEIECRARQA